VLTRRGGLDDLPAGVRTDDGSDLAGLVAALQEESGTGSTWLLGGGAVHRTFLTEGLVDEIWTHVMPLLLGDGIPMFPASYPATGLDLIESRTYSGGVVLLRYGVASPVSVTSPVGDKDV
jgi:dihydrofolate reductase